MILITHTSLSGKQLVFICPDLACMPRLVFFFPFKFLTYVPEAGFWVGVWDMVVEDVNLGLCFTGKWTESSQEINEKIELGRSYRLI